MIREDDHRAHAATLVSQQIVAHGSGLLHSGEIWAINGASFMTMSFFSCDFRSPQPGGPDLPNRVAFVLAADKECLNS